MFELGRTEYLWQIAKKYPELSNHPNTLKPLGYAHMINLIEAYEPKTVLEAGHGAGSFLFKIFKGKTELWGIDDVLEDSRVAPESLENTIKTNPHVKFVKGLLGNNCKELPENYFDFICSVSVIEHIPPEYLNSFFEESYRLLKPGGIAAHSYDVYYSQNTKPLFDAYEKNNFKWLKKKDTMNVLWESWLNDFDKNDFEKLYYDIVFENPLVVAEVYMWQLERKSRGTPTNHVTILSAARKPFENENEVVSDKKEIFIGADRGFRRLYNSLSLVVSGNKEIFIGADTGRETTNKSVITVSPENFDEFTYSKRSHIKMFKSMNYDKDFFKREIDFYYCDLKNYQDLLVYSFIKNNLKNGSRILDIGGGNSRVLNYFKNDFECWNVDNGDRTKINSDGIKLVTDTLGNFGSELPDDYFDFTFSISTFLNSPNNDTEMYKKILEDNNRILKAGGFSLHCSVFIYKEPFVNVPYVYEYFKNNQKSINKNVHYFKITVDDDLYFLSEKFYSDYWIKSIGKSFKNFGKPFSYNLLWQKELTE